MKNTITTIIVVTILMLLLFAISRGVKSIDDLNAKQRWGTYRRVTVEETGEVYEGYIMVERLLTFWGEATGVQIRRQDGTNVTLTNKTVKIEEFAEPPERLK